MARAKATGHQVREASAEAVEEALAQQAGAQFEWHYGRVTRMGHFEVAGGRAVTILLEEGGVTSQQGNITEEQWEIFRLAFTTNGRVAILSDLKDEGWMSDYRFLEAVR